MNHTTVPCSDDRLQVLLYGDDGDEDFQVATEHVQWCSHCQSRLAELAADRDEWAEAQRSLAVDEEEREIEDEQAERSWSATGHRSPPKQWTESMTRQLLDPPSHPEMLGRLGRYEIERLIGVGGMGVVFKGFDSELNRPVAAKILAPHLASSGAARKRFSREARAAAAVVDEHVVAIHNVESDGESPFLVMQYVAGASLQARLDRSGPLDVCEILRIGMQTAKGLSAAHAQGLIHRDVKPSNILLEKGVDRALLTDFGLARACDDASLTRSGHHPGTPQYMSPEQASGELVDQRSDLFSLGSVLYTMCTGRPPFRAETSYGILRRITDTEPRPIREVNPDIPEWLCAIIAKLMAKRREDRFASAEEVAELLEDCLAHVQQPAAVQLPWRKLPACDPAARQAGSSPHGALRLIRSPYFKPIAAAAFAFALIFAGVVIVVKMNQGTVTIESDAEKVPIRISQGDKVLAELEVADGQVTVVKDGQVNGAKPLDAGRKITPAVGTLDVMPLLDLEKDNMALTTGGEVGEWKRVDGDIVSSNRGNNTLWLPLEIDGHYRIRVEFTRVGSPDRILFVLPIGDMQRILYLRHVNPENEKALAGIDYLYGKSLGESERSLEADATVEGQRHVLEIEVGQSDDIVSINSAMDGKPFVRWTGSRSHLHPIPWFRTHNERRIAVHVRGGQLKLHKIELEMIFSHRTALIAALHLLAAKGEADHVRAILNAHPDLVDARRAIVRKGLRTADFSPLHQAVENGHERVVRVLLEHGAEVNRAVGSGWTPLHLAAKNGHLSIVKQLVEHGANVDAKTVALPETFESPVGASPDDEAASERQPTAPAMTPLDVAKKHAEVVEYLKAVK